MAAKAKTNGSGRMDAPVLPSGALREIASTGGRTNGAGKPTSYVRQFEELSRDDVGVAGGKGANLGELLHAGLPVPPGFVLTTGAFDAAVARGSAAPMLEQLVSRVNADDSESLEAAAASLREIVAGLELPEDVRGQLSDAYRALRREHGDDTLVAVRSSATSEDNEEFSCAGMFDTYLNVRNETELLRRVLDCWASSFGARALFYRVKQGMPACMPMAVVIQKMVQSEKAGVMFTVDPNSSGNDHMVIEAAWGLGEAVVGGQVTPDTYLVNRSDMAIKDRRTARKELVIELDRATGTTRKYDLAGDERATAPVLTDAELLAVARLGFRAEGYYESPQDIEFAIEGGRVYITQSRPITTRVDAAEMSSPPIPEGTASRGAALLEGLGASPGRALGVARVLATPKEAGSLAPGEILVAPMTTPDWVPLMRRAAAIVTNSGGRTSHAAIVSRELGIPCIVGTQNATSVLRSGMLVEVDAVEGMVYAASPGRQKALLAAADQSIQAASAAHSAGNPISSPRGESVVTATSIYVNLAELDRAEAVAALDVDGVGLLRAEFMLLDALGGEHPRELLATGRSAEFVDKMADKLTRFAAAFFPRPVIYRAMDFRSNEYRGLAGGEKHEPKEENPMLGYRGCYRYIKEPDLFALELETLRRVRAKFDNMHLMIPFVRTGWEFRECKSLIDASPLGRDRSLKLWVMAEVPSVVSWLDEYVKAGVCGVSIGSNDLTQLILGVDRDSEIIAPLYDERDRAVMDAIRAIVAKCRELGITCSICGQAPSEYPEFTRKLVEWGIDSISVNPDVVDRTRKLVAAAERRVLLDRCR